MVHVRFVQSFVAVEGPVFLHYVHDRNVAGAVSGAELVVAILEYGDCYVELVDKQTDVVFLARAATASIFLISAKFIVLSLTEKHRKIKPYFSILLSFSV